MPLDPPEADEPRIYLIRLSEPAEAEIDAAYLRLMGATSFRFADRWQDSLFQAIEDLSRFPLRHEAVAGEEHFPPTARRMLHRQGRVVFRVIFDLVDEDDDGQADTVVVQHVRQGAQRQPSDVDEDSV